MEKQPGMPLLRLAYSTLFLIALIAVFVAWGEVGGATSSPAQRHEDKVLLVLTLIIGAVVGLVVVAFILLTENLGARLYPPGSAAWRRILVPLSGALITGFLLSKYFPNARGSGI